MERGNVYDAPAAQRFMEDARDTATPDAMVALLERLATGKALSHDSTAVLLDNMENCRTGGHRMKYELPRGTRVAHKTGTLARVTTNDVGIITLPWSGGALIVAIYLTGSPQAARLAGTRHRDGVARGLSVLHALEALPLPGHAGLYFPRQPKEAAMTRSVLRTTFGSVSISLAIAVACTAAQAAQRAFVASYGSDANQATGCGVANPCRSFTAGHAAVSSGGEIIALDTAGYGPVEITKSVTVVAAPGAYAGITSTFAANLGGGVVIAASDIKVVLRGLNINATDGFAGIGVLSGASGVKLTVENTTISNFSGFGISVGGNGGGETRIFNTRVQDNATNIEVCCGGTAEIANSQFLGGNYGIVALGSTGGVTTVSVTDTVVSGSGVGVYATAGLTNTARLSAIRSTVSNNIVAGFFVGASDTANALITVSDCKVVGNGEGLSNNGGGTSSVLETLGNNTVRQNDNNTIGTITGVTPL